MSKIGLIIKREYSSRVKKASFIIMTILVPILSAVFLMGAVYLGMPEDRDLEILVVDEGKEMTQELLMNYAIDKQSKKTAKGNIVDDPDAALKTNFKYFVDTSLNKFAYEEIKEKVNSEERYKDVDAILYVPFSANGDGQAKIFNVAKLIYKEPISSEAKTSISIAVNNSAEVAKVQNFDIEMDVYKDIKSKINVNFIDINSENDSDSYTEIKAGIGFAFGLMIYMFIFMYGVQVMKGVIEEKSNRIVEVIVSSVKPFELMMGKIIGIMLVGLTQFLMWILLIGIFSTAILPFVVSDKYSAAFQASSSQEGISTTAIENLGPGTEEVANVLQDNALLDVLINQTPWVSLVFIFVFFFIGGYLLYGSLMAAIGAAVDSETDTQQFMLPVSMPLIFAYIISIMGIQDPNSTIMTWCSEIPLTSPIVMLVRYSALGGEGMTGQLILSMVLLIAAFIGTTWLAAKIYRVGILMYGKKVSYKELFKWLKY